MQLLQLRENEKVIINQTCDLWELIGQNTGVVEVTNLRLAFRYKTLLGASKDNKIEIDLIDIVSAKKCNVGPAFVKIIPTGVKVTMKNGKKYTLSLMKRGALIETILNNQKVSA